MRTVLEKKSGRTFLPDEFLFGHELCFLAHDALAQLLVAAEAQGVFSTDIRFRDEADKRTFEAAGDVFEWFEATRRIDERACFFRLTIFPALLSDFLHFVYEALESSRKAKLCVTYALLRKPLQENLFLLESIASDLATFSERFVSNPLLLRAQKAGGVDAHERRIATVLSELRLHERFDAKYLAQLRYDKNAEDGFDGICNTAVHLFTEHKAIQTDKMNINFIFSDWDSKSTQWAFLYSRLPYILSYAHSLTEYVFSTFQASDPEYLDDITRRLSASTILWHDTIPDGYQHDALSRFAESMEGWLRSQCEARGCRTPTRFDLVRMRADGAWPGEDRLSVGLRRLRFTLGARIGRFLAKL